MQAGCSSGTELSRAALQNKASRTHDDAWPHERSFWQIFRAVTVALKVSQ
jgi:hypothetical protein